MADIAASVLARLKNKATESGRTYQLCLQLFCQEEFLRRLEKSKYVDNLILKGGLFIYSVTNFDSRVTVDVDFLLRKVPNTPEELKPVLEEIIGTLTGNNFISFEIKEIAPIAVAKKYAGIGVSLVARIKNTRTPFSIDFGVGDVIVPKHEKRKIPTQLDDFPSPTVNTYSLETTIAEKIDAILSLMEFSSRMKDYYDSIGLPSIDYDDDPNKIIKWKDSGETGSPKNSINLKQLADQLQEVGEPSLFKYFLDGSRHVFKDDDIAYNKQVFPVVAGQIGIGCCKRDNKRM